MTRFYFYPDSAPEPEKREDGKLLYLWPHYEERDKIDEEGHWRIESNSLSELITILDNAPNDVSFTFEYAGMRLVKAPWWEDGIWHFEINLGSYGEDE